jgi:hypothetical protein
MSNTDPKSPLTRVVAFMVGLSVLGLGIAPILSRGSLFYTNGFGELVFTPFVSIFGLLIIWGALFKPEILDVPKIPTKRRKH